MKIFTFGFLGLTLLLSQTASAVVSSVSSRNDSVNSYYSFKYTDAPTYFRIYVDSDSNATTGYRVSGLGANYLLENGDLYRYSGSNGAWGWTRLKSISFSSASLTANFTIVRADIGNPASLKYVANHNLPESYSAVMSQTFVSATPTPAPTTTPTPTPTPTTTPVPPWGSVSQVSYAASTAAIINPDRGFFWMTDCRANPKSVSALQAYRTQNGHSVLHCMWYLRDFKTGPISSTVLNQLSVQMDNVRAAGFKMILRIAYTNTDINDAPLSVMRTHLDQIAPLFAKNGDIISVVQTGMIGQWGEMSTSANFGGPSTAQHWADRKALIDKLLSVVPADRQVAVRTPAFKMNPYGSTPLSSSEAFTSTSRARVAHYNDCFISSANDMGTYLNTSERPFMAEDTKYVSMSGETCAVSTYNDCAPAMAEMAKNHWSLLHEGYHTGVYDKWKAQGCFAQAQQRLGYRFALQSASLSSSAKVGGSLSVSFVINNSGFAAAVNPRKVEIVLRNTSTGAVFKLPMSADPRRWLPGSPITVSQVLAVPSNVPVGTYALLLNLPDPAPALYSRPEYSIQLANQSVWEASTGYNNLKSTVVIGQ